jgi:hypothetical protein
VSTTWLTQVICRLSAASWTRNLNNVSDAESPLILLSLLFFEFGGPTRTLFSDMSTTQGTLSSRASCIPALVANYWPSSAARIVRLSARRSSGYGRHDPARAVRRRVPRTRRRTLMVGELLYVGWAALTCSPLACAVDSRRAKAYDRLIHDGAGTDRRRYCRIPATASTPVPMPCPADSKPSAARSASWYTPPTRRSPGPSSAPTAPASSWRPHSSTTGHRPRARGDHHRRPCLQDRPHRGHPIRRSSYQTRADRHVLAGHRQRLSGRLARAQSGKQTSDDCVRPASW